MACHPPDLDLEYDHWVGQGPVGAAEVWGTCRECNTILAKPRPLERKSRASFFEEYQKWREVLAEERAGPDPGQRRLFS